MIKLKLAENSIELSWTSSRVLLAWNELKSFRIISRSSIYSVDHISLIVIVERELKLITLHYFKKVGRCQMIWYRRSCTLALLIRIPDCKWHLVLVKLEGTISISRGFHTIEIWDQDLLCALCIFRALRCFATVSCKNAATAVFHPSFMFLKKKCLFQSHLLCAPKTSFTYI